MTLPNLSGQAVRSGAPALPRVNLMPPEIHEAAKFRRFQMLLGVAGLGAVAIVGALYMQAHSGVSSAQQQLASATAQQQQLNSELAKLQPVRDVYAQVSARRAMLQQAMGSEIRWSFYLNDLSLKIPDNVWLTGVSATETGSGQSAGSRGVPSAANQSVLQTGIGSISFSGVAFSQDDVATWLDSLASEKGYVSVYFTNATESMIGPRKVVDFSSSVQLTPAALSNRYSAGMGN